MEPNYCLDESSPRKSDLGVHSESTWELRSPSEVGALQAQRLDEFEISADGKVRAAKFSEL